MSSHYLLYGPVPADDPALGPIDQLCRLLKLRGTIRILSEIRGGYTGARVFVAEEQRTPDDPEPFTLVFKVARSSVLRQELERYESIRRYLRARNAFAQIEEPGLTLQSLDGDYPSAIAYAHVAAPFGRRDSVSLADLVRQALENDAQMPLALEVVTTTMRAIHSMYARPEKEFAFHVERYYADRWLPHFRVIVDEAVLLASRWLLTRHRLNPAHFSSEPQTAPDTVRCAGEAPKCDLPDVVLSAVNVKQPVRDSLLAQESSLSIEIDITALPAHTRKTVSEQGRVSLWVPLEVRERRYERYSDILHRAFPGEDLSRAAVAIAGRWFQSPLHHLSQPLIETTRSSPATNAVPAHGDLHAGNVLVVGTAPVIIDYGQSEARLPAGVDAARLFGSLVRDVYATQLTIDDLTSVLCAVILEDDTALAGAPSRLAGAADLLRSIQTPAIAQIGDAGADLWALHLYAFAFIGLKWDAPEPFVEHRGCGVLAAVALTRVLGEPSPDDLLVAPAAARVLSGETIAPEGPAEILVLVAKFRGLADYDPTARVYQALADNLYDVLPEITRVEYVDREVLSRKDAIGLGQRYQASMVVWGSYDNLGVRPRYEVTRDSLAAKQSMVQLDEATRHALREKFDLYVTDNLGKEISFLSLKAVGAMCTLNLNHTAALDAYQKALSLVSRRDRLVALGAADIYRDIAGILFGLQRNEEALEANERALELAPDDLLTRVQMVTLRGTVEKRSAMQMITDLRVLIHERAESETDAQTKDALETVLRTLDAITSPAALKELVERARRQPTYTDTTQNQQYRKDVAVHLQKAMELDRRREYARALREYDQAIRLNQRCAYAIAERGTSLAVLNRIPEALAELERARRIDPNEILVYLGFAAIYYERGEYEKSLEHSEKARSLPFGKRMALRSWGLSLIALGRGDEVMTALKNEEVPLDSASFFEVRAAYFRIGGNLDAALREINEALGMKDEVYAEALLEERARVYAAQHRYDLALEDARQAVAASLPGTYGRHSSEIFLRDMEAAAAAYEVSAVATS